MAAAATESGRWAVTDQNGVAAASSDDGTSAMAWTWPRSAEIECENSGAS